MKKIFIAIGVVGLALSASAQNRIVDKFGKGISVLGKDSTFFLKANTRIQNRYDFERTKNNSSDPQNLDRFYVRRARIKFGGWAFSKKVKFKIEHDLLNGVTYDAVVKYNFYKGLEIWAGQTKLPGNRERVISSQKLQFVDRSLLNTVFTLDRDAGFQLRNKHKVGKSVIKEVLAVSQGEGLNDKKWRSFGHEFTGRVEFLPMGEFTSKGDYFGSDLKREQKPKLSIGVTYDYNENQTKSRKVKGEDLYSGVNVMSMFIDLMYKYKGLSVMGEYANADIDGARSTRGVNNNKTDYTDDDNFLETIYFQAGEGINIQAGYLFRNNLEVAGRFSAYKPFNGLEGYAGQNQFTFGLSKYVVGHSLKVQSDFTLAQTETSGNVYSNDLIFRFQVELAF
jgi:phosphate-selective porin OprO/OprP|tara:strand:+ start:7211 stop:8392 length:1182 start_codon:yes stop_codon:yes gene_type:complete